MEGGVKVAAWHVRVEMTHPDVRERVPLLTHSIAVDLNSYRSAKEATDDLRAQAVAMLKQAFQGKP
jgi:hypothetical protein